MEFKTADNLTYDTYQNESEYIFLPVYIIFEITFIIVCLTGLCSDIMVVYLTCRFKKLQTVPNIIWTNWAIADIYPLVLAPIDAGLYPFVSYKSETYKALAVSHGVGYILYNASVLFMTCLSTDWLLVSFFNNQSKTFRKYYKCILTAIWVVALSMILASSVLGTHVISSKVIISLWILYIAVLIFVIALHIARNVQYCKARCSNHPMLALIVVTIFVACWFERWLRITIMNPLDVYFPFIRLITYLTSTTIFIIMYCRDSEFQASFCQVWACLRRRCGGKVDGSKDNSNHENNPEP